ncbi:MAG: class I SAM-dependent methyltransferase [Burkholderiaceae bacterium]
MPSADMQWFDEAYYERFYFNPKTRVVDREHFERLGNFVCSYVKYLGVPVRRVLDVGCGIGLWRDVVYANFPQARYRGVELSPYLCGRMGWEQGSVVDYRSQSPFDVVICQGVLGYLNPPDLALALRNLGVLCQGVLYLEVATREDYERDVIDDTLSDPRLFRHRAQRIRDGLQPNFREMGGGLWLSDRCDVPTYELEGLRAAGRAGG